MGAPINAFEVVESIRFLASLVATEGVSQNAKFKANSYIEDLMNSLEGSVRETVAQMSGITLLK